MKPIKQKYIDTLRANYDNTYWWREVVAMFGIRPFHALLRDEDGGIRVMDQDWDNLIVLDACRADLFEEVASVDAFDEYTTVESLGSMTAEWAARNFADQQFGDTVYVSANPFLSKVAGDSFHRLREVWQQSFDQTYHTVLPESVRTEAVDVHDEGLDKRLIVHFMQPHYPFVRTDSLRFEGWETEEILDGEPRSGRPRDPWEALEMGVTTRKEVWDAYADNLELVLDEVRELLTALSGRTVVTSDHGNLLGERGWLIPIKLYGHPRGVRLPSLTRVPWAVVEGETRREVVAGETRDASVRESDRRDLEDKLRSLGYKQ